ncbi:polysaccharide deacetylase family protein [Gluconacetobacter sp. 1b LMG 1731]|uniref:Chitooligosaccharide deacetylase n=1 Tax=Gluconacetobacter dulcium TaxID=2729096 RepID=A0A7W4IJ74_9PROT|nr:polysaccharide deacetylase family protein [Gluconacetobacter dulcium]MBB2163816.1 polysaccharide deacetylase family protein [Gluconacetobacter dulcium]MBB2193142.1 polysaccharide deacetylase family protein [Gluconacetobacter dulcium]
MTAEEASERDFVGYGRCPPVMRWPGGARIAVSFVINLEEGAEQSVLDGDSYGETLGEVTRAPAPGERDLAMESFFEYGSRAGVWRLIDLFDQFGLPVSMYACPVALQRNPELAAYLSGAMQHEIVCHGYRWEEVSRLTRETERDHIHQAYELLKTLTGRVPTGWYCRYAPSVHTRKLLVEHGGFHYDCDSYADDLPYFVSVDGQKWCVVPHALDANDIKFWRGGFAKGDDFFSYLKDTFDCLYREGAEHPKMMTISLHCRIVGRPARAEGLRRFVEYISGIENVWFATRGQIADSLMNS